jgi:hypothetical protein
MQFSSTPERNRHITERSVILGRFTVYAAIKSPYSHGGKSTSHHAIVDCHSGGLADSFPVQ